MGVHEGANDYFRAARELATEMRADEKTRARMLQAAQVLDRQASERAENQRRVRHNSNQTAEQ